MRTAAKSSARGSAATFLDEGFIRRVYRTSVVVYALISVYVYAYTGSSGWLGFTAGTGLSLLSLAIVDSAVRRYLKRATTRLGAGSREPAVERSTRGFTDRMSPKVYLWCAAFLRYAVYALAVAAIAWAAQAGKLNLFAFLGGFVLVHAVIVLKAVGAALVDRGNSRGPLPSPRIGRGAGREGTRRALARAAASDSGGKDGS